MIELNFNADLLLICKQAQFYHPNMKSYQNWQYFLLAFICFCWLPPLLKIFIWANLFVEVAVAAPYIGKNHAWCLRKTLNRAFEITNYKHKNTGAGSISEGPSQPFRPSKYKQDNVFQGLYRDNFLIWLHQNLEYGLKTSIRFQLQLQLKHLRRHLTSTRGSTLMEIH